VLVLNGVGSIPMRSVVNWSLKGAPASPVRIGGWGPLWRQQFLTGLHRTLSNDAFNVRKFVSLQNLLGVVDRCPS
jgi:hypothetical protein